MDGPFSSTTAELMALALTVALIPKDMPATIYSDSKAALKIAENLLNDEDVRHEYEKSNILYLATKVRPRFIRRTVETKLKWVKGHSGVRGNELVDKAAEKAHADEKPWSIRLSPAPGAIQYRLCVGNQLAPMTAGRLVCKQGEQLAENRYLYHFVRAQRKTAAAIPATARVTMPETAPGPEPTPVLEPEPTTAPRPEPVQGPGPEAAPTPATAPAPATATEPEPAPLPGPAPAPMPAPAPVDKYKLERMQAELYAKAINMARDKKGRRKDKNSHRTTNMADHNCRSFGIKVGYGLAATMDRQYLYWPEAYPETEMRQCPRGCGQRETQAHMLTCTQKSTVQPPPQKEIEEKFGKYSAQVVRAHAFILEPTVLISEEWARDVKEATEKENKLRKKGKGIAVPGPTTFAMNMQHQIAERLEYTYERWKECNNFQIQ
ncbi:hypothetical protein GGF42_008478 [Coemansia sp. RSA 2424]|nr:hypothetical protein GGF42_008478 [Coemansia sp. RSA 2424]